jgi:21S rRNA (GM2251-2'-O)-methyltransferase
MVYPFLLRSTLLRTQHPHLPQTFRRYKSITAAIERGRQGGPDRPSRPRTTTRAPPEDGGGGDYKTRRELRFERFGPAKEEKEGTEREERPRRDRDERVSSPRSSRFGRVGSPRSRDDFPSQFSEGRDDKPFRPREDRPDRARDDRPPRENRFSSSPGRPARSDGEGKSSSDRFEGRERPGRREDDGGLHRKYDRFGSRPYEGGDRKPFDRGDKPFFDRGDRKPFDRGDRPFDRSDRKSYDGGDRKPYDRGDRKPFDRGDRKPYEGADQKPFDRSDSKPFDGDSTKPFHGGDRKPFDRGDHKSFDGDRKPYDRGDKKQFDKGDRTPFDGPRREAFGQRGSEFRSERPERSYNRRDESSSYTRDRPRREQTTESVEMSRDSTRDPESLPYTTAASEFIYGYSSVLAAMKANRRKLYSLYVHSRGASRDGLLARIRALKLFPITKEVGDEYMRAMDKASSGRPHNGVILESSPLPVPPITELKPASFEDESFSVSLDSQTAEDALVNGKQELYSYKAAGWRHPLVLYVDGVVSQSSIADAFAYNCSSMKAILELLLARPTFLVSMPL